MASAVNSETIPWILKYRASTFTIHHWQPSNFANLFKHADETLEKENERNQVGGKTSRVTEKANPGWWPHDLGRSLGDGKKMKWMLRFYVTMMMMTMIMMMTLKISAKYKYVTIYRFWKLLSISIDFPGVEHETYGSTNCRSIWSISSRISSMQNAHVHAQEYKCTYKGESIFCVPISR